MIPVGAVMSRYVEFLPAEATVGDAARMMGELDFGALPVGEAHRLDGIVTDRDILYRAVAAGLTPDAMIDQVMTRTVISCADTDSVSQVLDMMAAHHVRRMPVRHGDDQTVIGWITLSDLSRHLLLHSGTLQSALETFDAR